MKKLSAYGLARIRAKLWRQRSAGGKARALSLTPKRRTAIARKAARARWGKRRAA